MRLNPKLMTSAAAKQHKAEQRADAAKLAPRAGSLLGQSFMEDPRYTKLLSMLRTQTGPQGRNKIVNILLTFQDWLQNSFWRIK